MKVTLISPTSDICFYGLRSMSACLKKAGHEVQMIFLSGTVGLYSLNQDVEYSYKEDTMNDLLDLCWDSDIVGISVLTNYFTRAIQIAAELKSTNSLVVFGGVHATANPLDCLKHADAVCIGEGEQAIVELADNMEKMDFELNYLRTKNFWFNCNGKIIKNPVRSLVNLETLPLPDYSFENSYIYYEGKIQPLTKAIFLKKSKGFKKGMKRLYIPQNDVIPKDPVSYKIICSRGCVSSCSFCVNSLFKDIYGQSWRIRRRPLESIMKELEYARKEFNINVVSFLDDTFLVISTDRLRKFCKQYKERIGLPFNCMTSPLTITDEKMDLLLDAGLILINMGIQSGSEQTLYNTYNRKTTVKQILKASNILSRAPLPPMYDFIMDNPYETKEDIEETIELISQLKRPYILNLNSLTLFHGTELYTRAKKDGLISDETHDIYHKQISLQIKNYYDLILHLYRIGANEALINILRKMKFLNNTFVNHLIKSWNLFKRNKYFEKVKHELVV